MTDEQIAEQKAASIRETQDKTNQWLRDMGFWFPGQTKPWLMKRLAEFRRTSQPKPAGRDWARIILSKVADGKKVPIIAHEFAIAALREPRPEDEK